MEQNWRHVPINTRSSGKNQLAGGKKRCFKKLVPKTRKTPVFLRLRRLFLSKIFYSYHKHCIWKKRAVREEFPCTALMYNYNSRVGRGSQWGFSYFPAVYSEIRCIAPKFRLIEIVFVKCSIRFP